MQAAAGRIKCCADNELLVFALLFVSPEAVSSEQSNSWPALKALHICNCAKWEQLDCSRQLACNSLKTLPEK